MTSTADLYDIKFIRHHSTDWLSAAVHVRPSQNTQNRCATSTYPVYGRFSATPTYPVYDQFSAIPADHIFLFTNRFSLAIRATTYGTLSPLLTSLKLQIWTLFQSLSDLSTFRVYSLMSLSQRLFKSVLTLVIVRNILLYLFPGKSLSNLWRWLLLSSLASMIS